MQCITRFHKNETRYDNQLLTWPMHLEVHSYIYKKEPEIILRLTLLHCYIIIYLKLHCPISHAGIAGWIENIPFQVDITGITVQWKFTKRFRKCMALNCWEQTSPHNAECSVDVHMTVLIMAEQIIHVAMAGEAIITLVVVRLLPVFHLYILVILIACFWFTCTAPFHVIFTNTCRLILQWPIYPYELWK